ncbi:MAG: hypothetical protein H6901_06065 [Rhodobacteraceae bacterium]|nr:hypothetical protein [Paracoccaceae bacterium]MCP5341761.1 hypothetical protein [Paracoccaceae bacterium]
MCTADDRPRRKRCGDERPLGFGKNPELPKRCMAYQLDLDWLVRCLSSSAEGKKRCLLFQSEVETPLSDLPSI